MCNYSFNRTFMELKWKTALYIIMYAMFQSYLYGIEIQFCFLRRLKLLAFQSYLYGIEIEAFCLVPSCFVEVSIVPLWNWNSSAPAGSSSATISFQSYLYGIEIIKSHLFLDKMHVSIVPLWNWNLRQSRQRMLSYRFNRTFMELK